MSLLLDMSAFPVRVSEENSLPDDKLVGDVRDVGEVRDDLLSVGKR